MSWFQGIFKSLVKKREPIIIQVEVNEGGFSTQRNDGVTERVYWDEIERIYTYKVDCYAYDMIWLAFTRQDKDEVHIKEETQGFTDFMSAISKTFPNIDAEWYFKVMQPPFAENLTILYEREKLTA